jgi:hypothetical protein
LHDESVDLRIKSHSRDFACGECNFETRVAFAEVSTVTIARQYGIGYLALMIMERDKLIEKEAKAAGLGK